MVNIIIIDYNLPDKTSKCVEAVLKNTNYPYVITLFDNYNSKYTLTQIWNKLIKESCCDYVCLLNNDAYPTSGWLKKMVKTIESKQKIFKIGFVGPSTNNCHSPQKNINTPEFALQYEDKVEVMKDPISGFCLLFRKALWEELKGFDEAFTLYGQESDFIFRAKSKGYFCVWRKDAFVWHDGESSVKAHGKNIEKERKRGRELYWAKRRLK